MHYSCYTWIGGCAQHNLKFRQVSVAVWSFCPHFGSGLPTLPTIIQIPSQSLSLPFPKHRAALALFSLATSAPWPYLVCAHTSLTHSEWAPVFSRQTHAPSCCLVRNRNPMFYYATAALHPRLPNIRERERETVQQSLHRTPSGHPEISRDIMSRPLNGQLKCLTKLINPTTFGLGTKPLTN